MIDYDTETVRLEMLQAAQALKAMGVGKGDVVAVIGPNCLRYLMIDVAVGLAGAVSCPIYPTSPVNEINQILTDAGAKVFFVGIPKIFEQMGNIKTDIPIINFGRQIQSDTKIISWESFLSKATIRSDSNGASRVC